MTRAAGGASSGAATPRAWQRMLSGRRLDLIDPSPLDIEIEDIAHGLARVARWNGQTRGDHIFSVAQHTLLAEEVARHKVGVLDRRLRLALLLHDAPEYVIGDMISPFKAVIGEAYKAVERRLLTAIHLRFGLAPKLPAEVTTIIKAADRGAAFLEATVLARIRGHRGATIFRSPAVLACIRGEGLSHAMAGRDREAALPRMLLRDHGTIEVGPRLAACMTCRLSSGHARAGRSRPRRTSPRPRLKPEHE